MIPSSRNQNPLLTIANFYRPSYPRILVSAWFNFQFKTRHYLAWMWLHQDERPIRPYSRDKQTNYFRLLLWLVQAGMVVELVAGLLLLGFGVSGHLVGGIYFGLASIIAYPLVWGPALVVLAVITQALPSIKPKKLIKHLLCTLLERQVRQLRKGHDITVIAVAGSVGKTSTKLAIAALLGTKDSVQYQEGNYNDRLTVPLIFFGQTLPALWNGLAWLKLLQANRQRIRRTYPYKYVVIELGTDGPGQMAAFAYLKPDITVLTAVTPEHMVYFKTMDAVAQEELCVFDYSKRLLVNIDTTERKYLDGLDYDGYGFAQQASYRVSSWKGENLRSTQASFVLNDERLEDIHLQVIGEQGVRIALSAASVAKLLGFSHHEIHTGLGSVASFAGRMQILEGINASTIIDDTYNASPVAVIAGLKVLYNAKASQRIALLGSMNELGDYSPTAHKEVGDYCDPAKLDLVVTIGREAEQYLAPAAAATGCRVISCLNPYAAGQIVKEYLKSGAVLLAEGSQNGVFAEEALKTLLADQADRATLVRQSAYWMAIKEAQFPKH